MELTATQVNDFLTCPRMYWYAHVLELPLEYARPEMVVGKAIHAAIASVHDDFEKSADQSDLIQSGIDTYFKSIESQLSEHPEFGLDIFDLKPFEPKALSMITSYLQDGRNFQAPEVLTEVHFEFEIDGLKLRGYIDQLRFHPSRVDLVEIKTGKFPPSDAFLAMSPQFSIYRLAVERSPEIKEMVGDRKIAIFHLQLQDYLKRRGGDVYYPVFRDKMSLKSAVNELMVIKESIEHNLFPRRVLSFSSCKGFCRYVDRCLSEFGGIGRVPSIF